ncbi:MAG: hypothetical protein ACXW3Z_04515, partial [Limisphaerales bacterium]
VQVNTTDSQTLASGLKWISTSSPQPHLSAPRRVTKLFPSLETTKTLTVAFTTILSDHNARLAKKNNQLVTLNLVTFPTPSTAFSKSFFPPLLTLFPVTHALASESLTLSEPFRSGP